MSVDPKNFFTLFSNQWDEAVKREATKLVKEQACIERFQKLQDKFYDLEQILDNMASSINWNTENIFRKK